MPEATTRTIAHNTRGHGASRRQAMIGDHEPPRATTNPHHGRITDYQRRPRSAHLSPCHSPNPLQASLRCLPAGLRYPPRNHPPPASSARPLTPQHGGEQGPVVLVALSESVRARRGRHLPLQPVHPPLAVVDDPDNLRNTPGSLGGKRVRNRRQPQTTGRGDGPLHNSNAGDENDRDDDVDGSASRAFPPGMDMQQAPGWGGGGELPWPEAARAAPPSGPHFAPGPTGGGLLLRRETARGGASPCPAGTPRASSLRSSRETHRGDPLHRSRGPAFIVDSLSVYVGLTSMARVPQG